MKKLITILLICAAGATTLNSCKKVNADLCSASHDSERFTSLSIFNSNTFYDYNTKVEAENVSYSTAYEAMNFGKSRFYLVTKVTNVCNKADILLMPRTTLDVADPAITDTLNFFEVLADGTSWNFNNVLHYEIPLISPTVFQLTQTVTNKMTDDEGGYEWNETISIPSQGSREADSIYFWSHVSHMLHRSQYYITD